MSLIEKVKKAVPLASDPEPHSNLSQADFEDSEPVEGGDSDGENRDSEGSSSPDDGEEQSGSDGSDGSDGTNESPGEGSDDDLTDSDSHSGDGDGEDSMETDVSDEGGQGDADSEQSSEDAGGDSTAEPGETGENGQDGEDHGESDDGKVGEGSEENDDSSSGGQQSLFDYEDPENWSDPSGDDSAGETGDDPDEDGTNDSGPDESETGDDDEQDGEGSQDGRGEDSDSDADDGSDKEGSDESGSDGSHSDVGDEDDTSSGESEDSDDTATNNKNGEGDGSSVSDPESPEDAEEDAESNGDADSGESGSDDSDVIEPDNASPTPPGVAEDPYEPHPDLAESERNEIQDEKREREAEKRKAEEELEEFLQALGDDSGSDGIGEVKFNLDPEGTVNSEEWGEAVANKKRTANLLKKKLDQSRRDKWKRGRTKGRLDGKRMHSVAAKRLDIMKQMMEGNKKKYSVIVVLDRSASMRGEKIKIAQAAIARYALAMEDLKIEVCIMDMYNNNARIISPFGVNIESSKGDLMSDDVGGTTPLSDAVEIARKRMRNTNKFSFMISVTDGRPNDEQRYQEELGKAHMPVMGITIDPDNHHNVSLGEMGGQDQYYDIHTYVNSQTELEEQLEKMSLQIPF